MKRQDGTLPSALRLEACWGDPRILSAYMATEAGAKVVDKEAGLERLPSEKRLEVCDGDYRVMQALMATEAGAQAVDRAAGLA